MSNLAIEPPSLTRIEVIWEYPFRWLFCQPNKWQSAGAVDRDRPFLVDQCVSDQWILGIDAEVGDETCDEAGHQNIVERLTMSQLLFDLVYLVIKLIQFEPIWTSYRCNYLQDLRLKFFYLFEGLFAEVKFFYPKTQLGFISILH